MRLGILMDPLHVLHPLKDSTITMITAAQNMGWECAYFTQHDLSFTHSSVSAKLKSIYINDKKSANWATTAELGELPLTWCDILLMRKDPPFNMEYIVATYALELAERAGVLVANRPQSLRDANEKIFTLRFPQCCPQTLVSQNITYLRDFWVTHRQVIYKPLTGMGGHSIFYVDEHGQNLPVILEELTCNGTVTIMAQQYIPDIKTVGDKRILLINGEPIPYALARIPAADDFRGNLVAGADGHVVKITEHDRWICQEIATTLKERGLYFVGIDIIGDYLTEINVTSPTCICEISAATGLDIAGDYLRVLAGMVSGLHL